MILHRIDLYLFDDWSGLVRDCVKGLSEIVTLCQANLQFEYLIVTIRNID